MKKKIIEMIEMKNSTVITDSQNSSKKEPEFHLYKKRWLMLGIFSVFSFSNSIQWGEYIIINNLVMNYYQVPSYAVDWTMLVYMVTYLPLLLPALWLLDKIGIRYCMLLSSAGLSIGCWIKVYASLEVNRFSFVLIGQIIEAIFQVLIFGLAARVTAVWFGSKEVSFAFSLAAFGDQFGSAIGFFLPTIIVKNSSNVDEIGSQLLLLNSIISIQSTLIFFAVLFCFNEKPKLPPSSAQMLQILSKKKSIIDEIKIMIKKKSIFLITISYGINVASFNAFVTLFNEQFLKYFPENEEHIGNIGFLMLFSGIVGSLIFGYFLDKTHLFKETAVFMYGGSFLAMMMYIFTLRSENLIFVYVSTLLVGFFQNSYYSVAIQLAIELTYPVSECITSSYLLVTTHLFGIILINLYRYVYNLSGDLCANSGMAFVLLIGTALSAIIPSKLRRQNVESHSKCQTI